MIELKEDLESKSAKEILKWALEKFGNRVALASSFGAEDMVLTDIILKLNPKARLFTLDTGRLPQETYDVIEKTRERYGINIDIYFPDTKEVEEMESVFGPNLFYMSIANRKLCCSIRKIKPLELALKELDAWICGLRREQSVTRQEVKKVEIDTVHNNILKLNPLCDWTEKEVWDYIRQNNVPYNSLHDKRYPSIGCAPCTRPIKPGEDIRAGRWWWEALEHKECGLHIKKTAELRRT